MGVDVSWYVRERVIHILYQDSLNMEELHQLNYTVKEHYLKGQPADSILMFADQRELKRYPFNILAMQRTISIFQASALSWVILLGEDNMMAFFTDMVIRPLGAKIKRAQSVEQAHQILKHLAPDIGNYFVDD